VKVLILSRVFMKSHVLAGELTGFPAAFRDGRKLHTIRANRKGYYKDREFVSVRTWSGLPYCSKQLQLGGVRIGLEPVRLKCCAKVIDCFVGEKPIDPQTLAKKDGLTLEAFQQWFFPGGTGSFSGNIIHFTDMRYSL